MNMDPFLKRIRAFWDPSAWILIAIGIATFSVRVTLPDTPWVNLPAAITVFQTGGLVFALYGIQMMVSMAMWPDLNYTHLLQEVFESKNQAAGQLLLGLFIFNGLGTIGFCYWVTSALGMAAAR